MEDHNMENVPSDHEEASSRIKLKQYIFMDASLKKKKKIS